MRVCQISRAQTDACLPRDTMALCPLPAPLPARRSQPAAPAAPYPSSPASPSALNCRPPCAPRPLHDPPTLHLHSVHRAARPVGLPEATSSVSIPPCDVTSAHSPWDPFPLPPCQPQLPHTALPRGPKTAGGAPACPSPLAASHTALFIPLPACGLCGLRGGHSALTLFSRFGGLTLHGSHGVACQKHSHNPDAADNLTKTQQITSPSSPLPFEASTL